MAGGSFLTYANVWSAFKVDETALWLASLDGIQADKIEDLDIRVQIDYRSKAMYLHDYLVENDDGWHEVMRDEHRDAAGPNDSPDPSWDDPDEFVDDDDGPDCG